MELIHSIYGAYKMDECGREFTKGVNVSYSEIFCTLIKETVDKVENYQSDIYYDLKEIEKTVENFKKGDAQKDIYIGFRESGVDGNYHLIYHASENQYVYKSLFLFTIKQSEKWETDASLVLWRLDKSDYERIVNLVSDTKSYYNI